MIARKAHPQHPDDPARYVLVPLFYDRQYGECVPINGPEAYETSEFEAARICHAEWLTVWADIRRKARHLRAFCEHPAFASFDEDGINAEMITASARELSELIEVGHVNITRLFEPPTDGDTIRLGDVIYEPAIMTHVLVPVRTLDVDDFPRSPDALFARYLRMAFEQAQQLTSQPVSRRGFEDAIDRLILERHAGEKDPADDREPIQVIADERVARYLIAALDDAYQRTGRRVSRRGLESTILALEQMLEEHKATNGNATDQTDTASCDDASSSRDDAPTGEYRRPRPANGVVQREIDDEASADDSVAGSPEPAAELPGGDRGEGGDEKP